MSDDIDDGGQAFPVPGLAGTPTGYPLYPEPGMSLRDYFAAHSPYDELVLPRTSEEFESFLGLKPGSYQREIHWPLAVAKARYAYADAMLEERKKK